MINYNFLDLIRKTENTPFDFKDGSFPSSNEISDEDKLVDFLWSEVEKICETYTPDSQKHVKALKYDVLMSVYASARYTCLPTVERADIFSAAKEFDPALNNPDSIKSAQTNLSEKRKELQKKFTPLFLSGQQFDTNEIKYLSHYWLEEDTFKTYNALDFYYYLMQYSAWPYYPDHLNGMNFYKYFSGIENMFSHRMKNKSCKLEDSFSAYIFEELFHPINFISNLTKYFSVFSDRLYEAKFPQRERALFLLRPLFKLPHSLWSIENEKYFSILKSYIDDPQQMDTDFQACLYSVLFYKNFLFPVLQSFFSRLIFNRFGKGEQNSAIIIAKITSAMELYIRSNLSSFDYFTPMKKQLESLDKTVYPTKAKSSNATKQPPKVVKITDNNTCKRNNATIESFEINFTYNYFYRKRVYDVFELGLYQNRYLSVNDYLNETLANCISDCGQIQNGLSTSNYLQYKNKDKMFIIIN